MNLYEEDHGHVTVTVDTHPDTQTVSVAMAENFTTSVDLTRDQAMDLIGALSDAIGELQT